MGQVPKFSLVVTARGYMKHKSPAFFFPAGETRDLGDIALEPTGVLTLEVSDALDRPLDAFAAFCDGQELHRRNREVLEPGKHRYFDLPLGEVNVEVRAEGYRSRAITIDLKAGRVAEARLVLEEL